MSEALFHSGDFPHGRSRAQPYIPGLLFKSGMENIAACVGTCHSNPITVTIETGTMVTVSTGTDTTSTAAPAIRVPPSPWFGPRSPEPLGFINNPLGTPLLPYSPTRS